MSLFSKRVDLYRMFGDWRKKNSCSDAVISDTGFNMLSFLTVNNLLNEEAIEDFLKKKPQ